MKTKHPALKDKTLESFKRKKPHEHEEQKQLLKAITSSNVSALRASFLVANLIGKAKKHFTLAKEFIVPAAKDICYDLPPLSFLYPLIVFFTPVLFCKSDHMWK